MAIPKPLEEFIVSLKDYGNSAIRINGIELDNDGEYMLSTTSHQIRHPGKPEEQKDALYWVEYVAEFALVCIHYHVLLRGDESLYPLIEVEIEEYEGAEGFCFSAETGNGGCIISACCPIEVDARGRLVIDGDPKEVFCDGLVMLVDEWKKAYAAISQNLELENDAKVEATPRQYH